MGFSIELSFLCMYGTVDIWTFRLIESIGPEGRCFENKKKNSIKSSLFARTAQEASAGGRSPPQELQESLHSGIYLLVK